MFSNWKLILNFSMFKFKTLFIFCGFSISAVCRCCCFLCLSATVEKSTSDGCVTICRITAPRGINHFHIYDKQCCAVFQITPNLILITYNVCVCLQANFDETQDSQIFRSSIVRNSIVYTYCPGHVTLSISVHLN